ncbi:hypothetical protein V1525DRAFT_401087 [Lipomyces kononenkoae]|uniref:Uncharacterized protein n=1 Tax=Lipomyces kononenkoae TaxID=34357 RepID=A0ACC3T3X2_LIPKO
MIEIEQTGNHNLQQTGNHNLHEIPKTMRAWVHTRAGPARSVLQLRDEIPMPELPSQTSVLVRISHAALHPGESVMMNFIPFLFRKSPAVAETDFSGVIVNVGKDVPQTASTNLGSSRYFPPGTPVFGSIPVREHLKAGSGALAEYVAVEMNCIARKPDEVSFEEAAGLAVSGSTALTLIDEARLSQGQKVLVIGPCGGVGHFACQLARQAVMSDGLVLGICSSSKMNLAKRLGCDETLDYQSSPEQGGNSLVSSLVSRFGGDAEDNKFDVVIDSHGSQNLWHACPSFLKAGSDHPYVTVGPALQSYSVGGMLAVISRMLSNSSTPTWAGGVNREYNQITSFVTVDKLERLRKLAEEKKLRTHVGGVWEMEDALEVSQYVSSRFPSCYHVNALLT